MGLKASEEVFSAHRIVLAASSDYFHAMFACGMKESNQKVIELKDQGRSQDFFRGTHNSPNRFAPLPPLQKKTFSIKDLVKL